MAQAACLVTAGNWWEVGADSACAGAISDHSGNSEYPSLAIAPDGTPYVAWQDLSGVEFALPIDGKEHGQEKNVSVFSFVCRKITNGLVGVIGFHSSP
jgi:hypothetical protein